PIRDSSGALPFNRTGLGMKYHPFNIEITPYIATGAIAHTASEKQL
ncbi:unnamed protein product, partial [marine sediment metagenome]